MKILAFLFAAVLIPSSASSQQAPRIDAITWLDGCITLVERESHHVIMEINCFETAMSYLQFGRSDTEIRHISNTLKALLLGQLAQYSALLDMLKDTSGSPESRNQIEMTELLARAQACLVEDARCAIDEIAVHWIMIREIVRVKQLELVPLMN